MELGSINLRINIKPDLLNLIAALRIYELEAAA